MSVSRWLTPLLALVVLALAACSNEPTPSSLTAAPSVPASVAESASAEPTLGEPSASAAAVWPGIVGQMQSHLLDSGAPCDVQEETSDGFEMQCVFDDEGIDFTINLQGESDGSLRLLSVTLIDMAEEAFAQANTQSLQATSAGIAAPLFTRDQLNLLKEYLADYWSMAGSGTSITLPDSDITFSLAEIDESLPADSTVIIEFAPVEDEEAPTDSTGFFFEFEEIRDYYASEGFECGSETDDAVEGHVWINCAREVGELREAITLTTDPDGRLVDAIAVVGRSDGAKATSDEASDHISGFLGATLGADSGLDAADWAEQNNFGASVENEASYRGLQVSVSPLVSGMMVQISTVEYATAYEAAP